MCSLEPVTDCRAIHPVIGRQRAAGLFSSLPSISPKAKAFQALAGLAGDSGLGQWGQEHFSGTDTGGVRHFPNFSQPGGAQF